jgi:hypothetical protein
MGSIGIYELAIIIFIIILLFLGGLIALRILRR